MVYSTSDGEINVCDFREKSDFSSSPSIRMSTSAENRQSQYSSWLNYISSVSFLPDPNYLVSREYLNIKMWDLRKQKSVWAAEVNDRFSSDLGTLYRNDALDDEFFLATTKDGKHMVTGGYDKSAHVMDLQATTNNQIQCKHNQLMGTQAGKLKVFNR